MRLYLIRHPRPLIAAGVCYGQLDIPAENPARAAAALYPQVPPGLPLWSSPLRRCRDLARALAAEAGGMAGEGVSLRLDARLAEINFGLWEGRPWDAIPRAEIDAWAADVGGYAPPGGESPWQLQARVLDFFNRLPEQDAVIVTHAGVIRSLLAADQGLPPERWCELACAYASLTVWQRTPAGGVGAAQ
ncbi:MAG: alpha-ribazole phosphatase family protein [Azonexus sp.]|nr:alpha-ribazole phosphatase family protein [Azonexus sp.]MCK6411967.1 alpha-ribazole phosphatase family protein [Azonexus sp.]